MTVISIGSNKQKLRDGGTLNPSIRPLTSMELVRFQVTLETPKGLAHKMGGRLRNLLLTAGSLRRVYIESTEYAEDDSSVVWTITDSPSRMLKIQRNVYMYEKLISGVLGWKWIKKLASSPEDLKELEDLLKRKTRIEIIRPSQ